MVKYSELLDAMPPPPPKRGWWRFVGRHLPGVSVVLMVALLTATVLYPYAVITVPSGQVGVLWKRFNGFDAYCWCFVGRGTILDPKQLRNEGLHIVWPWDKLFLYDLRLHSTPQTYNAISKDGVSVIAQISIRFQLLHDSIAVLHKFIGPGYLESVVSQTPNTTTNSCNTRSKFSIPLCSASNCRPQSLQPSIARPSSTTRFKSSNSASSAKHRSQNASRSRRMA